ncbi:MAG: VRR-NUC domain-containing protein [candidate division WOR-3 bacterium]
MKEREIQKRLIRNLEREGWVVIKIILANKRGVPDIIAFRNGEIKFIEVKTGNNKLTPLQEIWCELIIKNGFRYEIVREI